MKVTIEKPEIISLLYKQEKTDEDYGSCMWARFVLDLKNYTMVIESDCGNYVYGWTPTPDHECFLCLLARINEDYLLDKISSRSVINGVESEKGITEYVKKCAEAECIELDTCDLEQISIACYNYDTAREVVRAVEYVLELCDVCNFDPFPLWTSVVEDYPANAKKIASVFNSCIRPKIKDIIKETEGTKC